MNLFAYGTIKRGGQYHDRIRSRVESIRPAMVCGRLYDLDAGYPALALSGEAIFAYGSADSVADAALADQFVLPSIAPLETDIVHGEILSLTDPARDLPMLDELEEYEPGRTDNLFERVLSWARTASGITPAWLYVGHPELLKSGRRIANGRWPTAPSS